MRIITSLLICALLAVPALAQTVDLNGSDWSLSFWVQPEEAVTDPADIPAGAQCIPATVPGNVDIDLMAAGLEADPRIGNNNYLTRKWECYQWCYTKDFNVPALEPGRHYELFFGGIDTIADIWLNGEHAETLICREVTDHGP